MAVQKSHKSKSKKTLKNIKTKVPKNTSMISFNSFLKKTIKKKINNLII